MHERTVKAARAAGASAARRHAAGEHVQAPDPLAGSLLARKASTAWHAGFAEARSASHAESKAASGYDGLTDRSGMISLDLPPGTVEPVPGGVADHHLTVVYLGPDVSDTDFAEACSRAQDAASRVAGPLTVSLSGIDSFPAGENGKKPVFIPASVPGGDRVRNDLADLSASEHPGWVSHVTTHYADADDDLPVPQPDTAATITHLSVHRGDDVRRFPFGGTKEADMQDFESKVGPKGYIHGWIHVGAPGVGDDIHHPSHGKGKVTAVSGSHVTAKFTSGATRSFPRGTPPKKSQRAALKPERAAHDAVKTAQARAAGVHQVEKARGEGHLHPLAKTGPAVTDAKGTTRSTAVDHEGREFRLKSNRNKVTVRHGDQSMSSSDARNPTLMAREMAGKLAGSGDKPKASATPAEKPLAPGLSDSYIAGKGATDADVAELSRRYEVMHGKKPSAAQLAKIKRAKPAAGTAKPGKGKPMPHHAARAHAIADDARTERGLNGFQREEAANRLRSAGRNLSAGNHDEAVTDLDDATRSAGTPGGGVIKGSTAARAKELAAQVRAEGGNTALHGPVAAGEHVRVTSGYHAGKEGNIQQITGANAVIRDDKTGSNFATGKDYVARTGKPSAVISPTATTETYKPAVGDSVQAGLKDGTVLQLGRRNGVDVALVSSPVSEYENRYGGVGYAPHWVPLTQLRPANQKKSSLAATGFGDLAAAITSSSGRETAVRRHLAAAGAFLEQGDVKTACGALELAQQYARSDSPDGPVLLGDGTEAWQSITSLRDSLRTTDGDNP